MRRIFTFSFIAIALSLASFNSFGQTASCSTPTTSGTATDYNQVDASITTINNAGGAVTYNSPISTYSFTTPPPAIPFYLKLRKIENGGSADFTAQVTIKWGTGGANSFTCAVSGTIAGPAGSSTADASTNYYFTITPNTPLPQGTNFQISVAIDNVGNKQMQITGYAIDKNAQTPGGAALPVKFQTFEATPSSNSVSLKWMVATEENLSGYEIEKSFDGRNFSKLSFVNAVNQSTYTFVDSKSSGTVYYRIKSIDVDGRYAFSTIALIKAGKSMIMLNAFPSPFVSSFSLDHGTATAGSLITISGQDGRAIKTIIPAVGSQRTPVDLSAAKAGMYLVRYKNGNGEVETLKILKQQ
jgi:hypothetical protein